MTKCIVLGEAKSEEPKKAIEFNVYITYDMQFNIINRTPKSMPKDFKVIELICRNWEGNEGDLMFAYDISRENGSLYLGHWNDGVV